MAIVASIRIAILLSRPSCKNLIYSTILRCHSKFTWGASRSNANCARVVFSGRVHWWTCVYSVPTHRTEVGSKMLSLANDVLSRGKRNANALKMVRTFKSGQIMQYRPSSSGSFPSEWPPDSPVHGEFVACNCRPTINLLAQS